MTTSSTPPPLRLLLIGCGPATLTLATLLAPHPTLFHLTILERFPALRQNGLQIDLRGHAISVITKLNLRQKLKAKVVDEKGIELVDDSGKRWGFFPRNDSGKGGQAFTSEWEIMRGDLCGVLYDEIMRVGGGETTDSITWRFNTTVTSLRPQSTPSPTVLATFSDSTSAEFDLVIGGDGLHSKTRRMMLNLPPSTPDPSLRSLHNYIAYCRIPIPSPTPTAPYIATTYLAPKGRFILTRRHSPSQIQVYLGSKRLTTTLDGIKRGDVAKERKVFCDEFRDAGWRSKELIGMVEGSEDFYCQQEAFVDMGDEGWTRGRVTLVGDAGYSVSTNGYGTSCAVVGAYVLAGELVRAATTQRQERGVEDALGEYEKKVKPLVKILQKGLEESSVKGEKKKDRGVEFSAWQLAVLKRVVWAACGLRMYKLMELSGDRGMRDWELPEYPELGLKEREGVKWETTA